MLELGSGVVGTKRGTELSRGVGRAGGGRSQVTGRQPIKAGNEEAEAVIILLNIYH